MEKRIKIGIPRALLYYRYHVLWITFFRELGVQTVISGPTSRKTVERGENRANAESCLSLKIYFGHVEYLLQKCDYILVPHISNMGRNRTMCARFFALYDLTKNVFRDTGQKFLTYDVNVMEGIEEEAAFVKMGQRLGFSEKQVKRAYKIAKKAESADWKRRVQEQNRLYHGDGMKILLVAHSYLMEDAYMGKVIVDFLRDNQVIPVFADITERDSARKYSSRLSPTCKWEWSRELLGSIEQHKNQVNGIILVSAFPCNPDAMVNELITRRVHNVPILNLVLDGQCGTAGVETRLESFIDIIRFKEGCL